MFSRHKHILTNTHTRSHHILLAYVPTTDFSPRTTLLTLYTIITQADHVRSSFSYRMYKWYPEIPVHSLLRDR